MLSFIFNLFLFFFTDPPDCQLEQCSEISFTCPHDSKPKLNLYHHQINNQNQTIDIISSNNNEDNDNISKSKRSVQPYKRRETIKIVPGDHINHKRSIDDTDEIIHNNDDEQLLYDCCIRLQCACDTICQQPTCKDGEKPIEEKSGTLVPGQCCPVYKCHHDKCYSRKTHRYYAFAESWNDDECTLCTCDRGGKVNCQTSFCKPLSCQKILQHPGECCPVCDSKNSEFCSGQEDCEIVCRHGHVRTVSGCKQCKCINPIKETTTLKDVDNNVYQIEKSTNNVQKSVVEDNSASNHRNNNNHNHNNNNNIRPIQTDPQTEPTVMSIQNYFEEHIMYIIVFSAGLISAILVFGVICCKFSKKNSQSYNIVPDA